MMGTVTPLRDDLRDRIKVALTDPTRVCDALGITEGSKRQSGGLHVRCPAHAERTASCSVTVADGTIRVRCFGCDLAGDVFNLIAAVAGLSIDRDFPAVLARAADIAGIDADAPPRGPAPTTPRRDVSAEWDTLPALDCEGWEYLRGRGLDAASDLTRFVPSDKHPLAFFGAAGFRLAVALRSASGRVVAIQMRTIDGRKDFRVEGTSADGVFGDPRSLAAAKFAVIAEGLSDYLAAAVTFADDPTACVLGVAGVTATQCIASLPWASKRAVVAFDADDAGDKGADALTRALESSGALPVRYRPTGGKDLCDAIGAGVDVGAAIRGALLKAPQFATFADRIEGERAERMARAPSLRRYGVPFLDAAMGGMFPDDVTLLGARTGGGKTELAGIIADANAADGARVHFFALEAADRELERRKKYRLLAAMVYGAGVNREAHQRLTYLDWLAGKVDDITGRFEAAADKALAEQYRTLKTYYRVKDFKPSELRRIFREIRNTTDLVVIDHFHFIDNDHQNETRGQQEIAQSIHDGIAELGRPALVVAHLRKAQGGKRQIVPTVEDFHGASALGKISTRAILLARAHDVPPPAPYLIPTYINPDKHRQAGERTQFVGLATFNVRTMCYERAYSLGRVNPTGEKWTALGETEYPEWAKRNP